MKRKLTGFVAATLAMGSMIPAAFAATASDVDGAPNQSAIQEIMDLGIINPYKDGTFQPQAKVTRGQFVSYIYTILSKEGLIKVYRPKKAMFKDVGNGIFCYNQVNTMAHLGYAKGLGNGSFGQGWTVPATWAAEVMLNVLKAQNIDGTDYNSDDPYAALNVARNLGLFDGTPQADNLSGANYYLNRSQTAQVLENLYIALKPDKFNGVVTSLNATAEKDSITVGDQDKISVVGQDPNGGAVPNVSGVKFRIISDNAADASVSADGTFTATKAGNYTVQAYVDDGVVSNDVAITVNDALAISSVKQTAATKIDVTFNQAVPDGTTVTLSANGVNYPVTVTWNADKTVATLDTGYNLPAGTYTVTSGDLKQDVTIAASTPSKVVFTTKGLTTSNQATVDFGIQNQFGEDISTNVAAGDLQVTAYDATAGKNVPFVSLAPVTTGGFEATLDCSGTSKGDNVIVTVIDAKAGLSQTVTVPVVGATNVAAITLGSVTDNGSSKLVVGDTLTLGYTATDVNGNAVTIPGSATNTNGVIDGIQFVSSDPTIVNTSNITVSSTGQLQFTAAKSGTVTITAVVLSTGASSSVTFTTANATDLKSFSVSAPTSMVVAQEATTVPYTAVDAFGNQIAQKDFSAAEQSQLTITSSNPTVIPSDFDNTKPQNTSNHIYFDPSDNSLKVKAVASGSATLYVYLNGTLQGSVTFNVQPEAYPVRITGQKDIPAMLEYNAGASAAATATLSAADVTAVDQYGRPYTLGANDTLTASTTGTNVTVSGLNFTATSTYGTESVTLTLKHKDSKGNSTPDVTYTFNVGSEDSSKVTSYSLDVPTTIYDFTNSGNGAPQTLTAASYEPTVTLVGKDASGNTVGLAAVDSTPTLLTSSDSNVVAIDTGNKLKGLKAGSATITAWSSTGAQVASTTITVKDDTPVATTLSFNESTLNETTGSNTLWADLKNQLTYQDQYGITIPVDDGSGNAINGYWASDTPSVVAIDPTTKTPKLTGTAGVATLTFIAPNGKTATIKVVVQ